MKLFLIVMTYIYFLAPVMAQSRPDTMPVYPGCETAKQKMPCLKEKLLYFIAERFNQDLLYDIKDDQDVQMLITFTIDVNGKLSNIKIQSPYKQLNNEMKRVVSRLPEIKPAQSQNTPVAMQYQLPVNFNIKK